MKIGPVIKDAHSPQRSRVGELHARFKPEIRTKAAGSNGATINATITEGLEHDVRLEPITMMDLKRIADTSAPNGDISPMGMRTRKTSGPNMCAGCLFGISPEHAKERFGRPRALPADDDRRAARRII
jgi:hypothetical protein